MRLLRYATLLSIIVVLLGSCRKEADEPTPDTPMPPGSGRTLDVTGSVINNNGDQLSGATVDCNGISTTTDSRGVFRLRNVPVREGSNFVRVRKSGFFNGGRIFQGFGDEDVAVKVKLLPKVQIGSFQASAGGSVSSLDGVGVTVPANAIANGYQGTVRVFAQYMDPTGPAGVSPIPGMDARSAANENGVLLSFGMAHIELEDASGNALQLEPGSMAQLTMPIPSASIGAAPDEIPLWYFSETEGLWLEEGSAQRQGTNYVGEVAHFTPWNCDLLDVCSTRYQVRISCSGEPYAYLPVYVELRMGGFQGEWGTFMTTPSGYLYLTMPCSGEAVLFAVDPATEEHVEIGEIGPFSSAPDIVPLTLNGFCTPRGAVHGSAVTGTGQPVTNGYVYLDYGSFFTEPIFFDEQGNFNAFFYALDEALWNTDAQLVGWDLDQFITAQGPVVQFNGEVTTLSSPLVFGGEVASVDGRIYVVSTNSTGTNAFYCLDASDGSMIWNYEASQNEDEVSPVFASNLIVFRNLSGLQYALNSFDGSQVWTGTDPDGMSPFYADGVIYFATRSGTIRARDAATGSSLWTFSAGAGLYSSPTVVGNTLYCGSGSANPRMLALDKTTGTLLWEHNTSIDINTSPCVADGKVFFGTDDQVLRALDATTGDQLWEITVDDCADLYRSPTAGNGIVYIQACSELHAVDMNTGTDVWSMPIVSGGGGNDPYLYNGKLYVGGNLASGWFHCLDAQTGSVIWSLEGSGFGTPADYCVAANDVLFIHRDAAPKTMEARNALTGALIWTSPVAATLIAPMVLVDDNGMVHYTTNSGMQQ
ncbi:MAG TPA: PQQ-binding-like beta-propeller repeat protein [Flavobacteriales bacterium]|nr:PQQ-binding-like beta-propeller repeat protein [Flavobacteriales bacterium]